MIENAEVAGRYARALFEAALETKSQEKMLEQLRELSRGITSNAEVLAVLKSHVVTPAEKKAMVQKALADRGIGEVLNHFIALLGDNNRLQYFAEVVDAFQKHIDDFNGVVRGEVRSVSPLYPEQRKSLEERVSKVAGKRAILDYREDPALIGGLIATVGPYTFDDSLETQLRNLDEDLKRRMN